MGLAHFAHAMYTFLMLLVYILLSTFVIGLGSLLGIFTLFTNRQKIGKVLLFLISLSAGVLMGTAFFHLVPESLATLSVDLVFVILTFAFFGFFVLEKLLHWRHCHEVSCPEHAFAWLNLAGDALHNFLDGLVIAAAFLTSVHLGVITTLAVALHEIPQEISDFGVLVYAGFSRRKALVANFLVAMTAVIGGVFGYFLTKYIRLTDYLLPVAAGGFLYIAASDLLPEVKKEVHRPRSVTALIIFFVGLCFAYLTSRLE